MFLRSIPKFALQFVRVPGQQLMLHKHEMIDFSQPGSELKSFIDVDGAQEAQ